MRKLFKERKLFKGGNYMRKYGRPSLIKKDGRGRWGGGCQKLPNSRRHNLWTAPCLGLAQL